MMTRIEFTSKISILIMEMVQEGEQVILDYAKRSDDEQKRLFDAGLSRCDGKTILSPHQLGKAVDLYFINNGKLTEPKKGFEYWHKKWEEMGGREEINWDKGHFEG